MIVQYLNGTTTYMDSSTVVGTTGTDGCGTYQIIQATHSIPGIAMRGLVWVGTGARWYDTDGLNTQPIHSHC